MSDEIVNLLLEELRAVRRDVADTREQMAAIRVKVESNTCPAPGLCLENKTAIDEVLGEVIELKNDRAFQKGAAAAISVGAGVVGSAITAALAWFKQP
jgi:hypothetical protein